MDTKRRDRSSQCPDHPRRSGKGEDGLHTDAEHEVTPTTREGDFAGRKRPRSHVEDGDQGWAVAADARTRSHEVRLAAEARTKERRVTKGIDDQVAGDPTQRYGEETGKAEQCQALGAVSH